MSNFILFGLVGLGSIGLVGMLLGFQWSNLWWVVGGFIAAIIGYAIYLWADPKDLTIEYSSPKESLE